MSFFMIAICTFVFVNTAKILNAQQSESKEPQVYIESSLNISDVPSEFPVGFCLLTKGSYQYVAYYDAQHNMTVASRELSSEKWQYQVLSSKIEWDSHNYITMVIDKENYLHLSGNMHAVPLIYFRTTTPLDITTFKKIDSMTGENENRCTYPIFMIGTENSLLFHYRDGGSGSGNEIYNVYDYKNKKWSRLLETPLIDGKGKMNAYMSGPTLGSDGWFHLCWVWRDSPDCSTNHHPSYARSRNLTQWETIDGKALKLPITFDNKETIIDPISVGDGIINGVLNTAIDNKKEILASYVKYDKKGNTQVFIARYEFGKWVVHQITNWEYRWEFKGGGTISFDVNLGVVKTQNNGTLELPYNHIKYGQGILIIDDKTLELISTKKQLQKYPTELCMPKSDTPKMNVRWCEDSGYPDEKQFRYVLRWETLPANRDKKLEGEIPKPTMLKVYKIYSK